MKHSEGSEKVFLIGARRGLGQAVAQRWSELRPEDQLWLSSRREFVESVHGAHTVQADLSRSEQVDFLWQELLQIRPQRLFCFAGGGPYGAFADKSWKDHQWALEVSVLAPLRLLHKALQAGFLKQAIFVGSQIAEDRADPNAASYSAAKHALKGALSSLQGEEIGVDLRLFSPGYMATDMLPPSSREGRQVLQVDEVAQVFVDWALQLEATWHLSYPPDEAP